MIRCQETRGSSAGVPRILTNTSQSSAESPPPLHPEKKVIGGFNRLDFRLNVILIQSSLKSPGCSRKSSEVSFDRVVSCMPGELIVSSSDSNDDIYLDLRRGESQADAELLHHGHGALLGLLLHQLQHGRGRRGPHDLPGVQVRHEAGLWLANEICIPEEFVMIHSHKSLRFLSGLREFWHACSTQSVHHIFYFQIPLILFF